MNTENTDKKPSRMILRLLVLWLLTSALCMDLAVFNTFWEMTNTWIDVVFGIVVIGLLMDWVAQPAALLFRRRGWRWGSLGLVILAGFIGIAWAFFYSNEGILRDLLSQLPFLAIPNDLVNTLRQYNQANQQPPFSLWLQLSLTQLILGALALVSAIAARILWEPTRPTLASYLVALHVQWARLPLRPGRWLAWGRRLLGGLLLLSLGISGLAYSANQTMPELQWQAGLTGPDVPPLVYALLADEQTGALYAGTDEGVFRSADGGKSWQAASAGLTNTNVRALAAEGDVLVAGTYGTYRGVFRSTDGGQSWQAASAGLPNINVRALAVEGDALYAGTSKGVFRSADGGQSWQAASAGLPNTTVWALAVGEYALYAGTLRGVFCSADGGQSWQAVSAGLTNSYVNALAVGGDALYAGTDGGVFRSADGGQSWQAASAGLTNMTVRALAVGGDALYAGTDGGVFRSADGGQSWQAASAGLTNTTVRALAVGGDALVAGTLGGGVFRSADGGKSWQAANAGLTNTRVLALVVGRDALYAGTRDGGVFRSADGGQSWQAASAGLPNTNVRALAVEGGALYAGTSKGVFRSTDGGQSWQAASAGLTNSYVNALAVGGDALYAGTDEGVFRSADGGQSWQAASAGLPNTTVWALAVGEDALYAGTFLGVFRSADGGQSWQAASAGLTNSYVQALAVEGDALVAGTYGGGVFCSADGGQSWQAASAGLANSYVQALAVGGNALYAGTDGGVFRSADGGQSWQAASAGLPNTWVQALAVGGDALYAGTYGGVFRSADGGQNWQAASAGLTNSYVNALTVGGDALYAGTYGGVFRSADGGQSWQAASAGLTNSYVNALAVGGDALYAGTYGGVFRSADGGQSWERLKGVRIIREWLLCIRRGQGVVSLRPDGIPVWAVQNGGAPWISLSGYLEIGSIQSFPDRKIDLLSTWGATIAKAELRDNDYLIPSVWLLVRAWAWMVSVLFFANTRWLVPLLIGGGAFSFIFTYFAQLRPFGLPFWAVFFPHRRRPAFAWPTKLEAAWPAWERALRAELLRHGDVIPDDLLRVPVDFSAYTLERYAQTHADSQVLEVRNHHLRLLTGDRLRRWHGAWYRAGRALGVRPGLPPDARPAVDALHAVLCEVLGFTPGETRDFEAVRGGRVAAPALRLNIPLHFPLLFVGDPQPGARTMEMLVDAVDVLKETGYFALVVPLEPPARVVDTAAELRAAVARSPHVQDFIVLSQDDVLNILSARHPNQTLARCILAQVDLALVAPFVVNGPVPETMFFGREAEVKMLVEGASGRDFAIVGNRKIGKTSLLRRAGARLAAGGRVTVLTVDSQTVPYAADFYVTFQAQTGLALSSPTPEGFRAAIEDLRRAGPLPVLLLDEVDALLTLEKTRGEPLIATWRALAQAGLCHFIFCGSTGLARRLDDPHSVFFNFPQAMSLSYLEPETARQVLSQPCKTLGLELEEADALLERAVAITSGHPNLLQVLGKGLVDAANRRGERRILLEDLDALLASADFNETFLKIVWGEAGPLEKLITLVAPPDGFTLPEIEAMLTMQEVTFDDESLDAALKMLRTYAILEKRDRAYIFIPQAFPDILHRTQEVARLIAQEKRKLGQSYRVTG